MKTLILTLFLTHLLSSSSSAKTVVAANDEIKKQKNQLRQQEQHQQHQQQHKHFLRKTIKKADDNNKKSSSIYVGGWDKWKYVYESLLLPMPAKSNVLNSHGLHISSNGTIILTYQDANDSSKCLVKWNINEYNKPGINIGPGKSLCDGVPHGLRASIIITEEEEGTGDHYDTGSNDEKKTKTKSRLKKEKGITHLYHANNEQKLHKTTINGDIIWSSIGPPKEANNKPPIRNYKPTWFAVPPSETKSPFVYMADGYGSNKIYVYYNNNGTYTNYSFGGHGTDHGYFSTCHSITYDIRMTGTDGSTGSNKVIVSDRENHRLEYYNINLFDPSIFTYDSTTSLMPYIQRPCNIRFLTKEQTDNVNDENDKNENDENVDNDDDDGIVAIVPALEGVVGIINKDDKLLSVINITNVLGESNGFLHPHDAHFVPGTNGDFILVTWNPGRIGYFRRIKGNNVNSNVKQQQQQQQQQQQAVE